MFLVRRNIQKHQGMSGFLKKSNRPLSPGVKWNTFGVFLENNNYYLSLSFDGGLIDYSQDYSEGTLWMDTLCLMYSAGGSHTHIYLLGPLMGPIYLRSTSPPRTPIRTGVGVSLNSPVGAEPCRDRRSGQSLGSSGQPWGAWCAPRWMTCATWAWSLAAGGRWSWSSSHRLHTRATRSSSTCRPSGRSCCRPVRNMAPPDPAIQEHSGSEYGTSWSRHPGAQRIRIWHLLIPYLTI